MDYILNCVISSTSSSLQALAKGVLLRNEVLDGWKKKADQNP